MVNGDGDGEAVIVILDKTFAGAVKVRPTR